MSQQFNKPRKVEDCPKNKRLTRSKRATTRKNNFGITNAILAHWSNTEGIPGSCELHSKRDFHINLLNSDRLLTGIAALINNREAEKEIHWSKLVQVISDAGIKYVDGKVNIDSSHWSKIVNKKIHVAPSKKGLQRS
jgi:hypothetical protein